MPTTRPTRRSSGRPAGGAPLGWLVVVLLLVMTSASVAGDVASAQSDPGAVTVTVLVDGLVDDPPASALTLSAGRITLDAGRTSTLVTTRATVFVVVESGTLLLETDQPIPGARRVPTVSSGLARGYTLAVGTWVQLRPNTRLRLRNDGPAPVVVFLLSLGVGR